MTSSVPNSKPRKKRARTRSTPTFAVGAQVGKKKVSASLHLPNKTGIVIGHGEKTNAAGAVAPFYLVETAPHGKIEEWVPGIVYLLNTSEPQDRVAFM
jgi:hypothetical protein